MMYHLIMFSIIDIIMCGAVRFGSVWFGSEWVLLQSLRSANPFFAIKMMMTMMY